MARIFLTLAIFSTALLLAAFGLGLAIGDPAARDDATLSVMNWHLLISVAALIFAALVHAIVLTYFMGTGRWMEETGQAYRLPESWRAENQQLKYRTIPLMAGCLVLLILNIPLGAAADPRTGADFGGWLGLSAATLHLVFATLTVAANAAVNVREYRSICRNGELVNEVLKEVRRIREERGLPV